MTAPVRSAYPSDLPYAEADLLAYLRISGSAPTELNSIAKACVEYIEDQCGITIMQTTWVWTLDSFYQRRSGFDDFWYAPVPIGSAFGRVEIRLPRPKLSSVTSIAYTDTNGDAQTLDASKYQVDTVGSRILPTEAQVSWPDTADQMNAVVITYVSGYSDAADVPPALKMAVYELITQQYDVAREAGSPMSVIVPPHGFDDKLNQFKQWSF